MRNDEIKEIEEDEIKVEVKTKSKPVKKKEPVKPKEMTNAPVTIALTPTQKAELNKYADDDDRSVSYIVRKLLEKHKIISKQ